MSPVVESSWLLPVILEKHRIFWHKIRKKSIENVALVPWASSLSFNPRDITTHFAQACITCFFLRTSHWQDLHTSATWKHLWTGEEDTVKCELLEGSLCLWAKNNLLWNHRSLGVFLKMRVSRLAQILIKYWLVGLLSYISFAFQWFSERLIILERQANNKSDSKPPSRVKITSFSINDLSEEMNHVRMKGDLKGIIYLQEKKAKALNQ